MSDLIDALSDHDDHEQERIRRVARCSNVIFDSLFTALNNSVSRYNERHPQGFGSRNAIWIKKGGPDSQHATIRIDKNVDPKTSLSIVFPINSGAMDCDFDLGSDQHSATIRLDISETTPSEKTPAFHFDGEKHSAESIAEVLLRPVLTGQWPPRSNRPIGFHG